MASAQFIAERPLSLHEVKEILEIIEKREQTLNRVSNKVKEYLQNVVSLKPEQAEKLRKKLVELGLTRLKEEHIAKIVDFLPKTANELKVVFLAYHLSLPKKDQESIIAAVNEVHS